MSDLRTAIKQVIQKVEKHRDLYARSEQSVRDQLINPILKALGWDTSEPDFVHANVTNDDGKIPDYTLLKGGAKKLILEAKKLSRNLDDGKVIRQLADYCYPHGIEFGILTDGVVWQLFNTFEKNPNNRIVWTVDISQCEDQELLKLEMLCYEKIENLEDELNQTKVLTDYFNSIFQTKDSFLKWSEIALREKFLKDNKQYRFKEESILKYITQKLNVFSNETLSINEELPINNFVNLTQPKAKTASINNENEKKYRYFDINSPDDLRFTKIITGRIDNETSNNWNDLVRIIVKQLILAGNPIKELTNIASLNIEEGNLSNNGFCKIEGTPYSLQNVSASRGGVTILLLAKKYDKRLEIEYTWAYQLHKAAYPNEYGKIINN